MGISAIFIPMKDFSPELGRTLTGSKLLVINDGRNVMAIDQEFIPPEGSLVYQGNVKSVHLVKSDGMTHEDFLVAAYPQKRRLVFSRIAWLGYSASLNDVPIPVMEYENALVSVELPAGAQGDLSIQYIPVSWRYTKWSIAMGVFLLLLLVNFKRLKLPNLS